MSYTLTFDKSETRNKPQRSIANKPFLPTDSFTIVDPLPGPDTPGQPAEVVNITNSLKHLRPSNYLIITTPSNYHAIKQYSEWKKMLGHKVQIVATENWSRQLIKSTIASCYQNDTALHYVLFAGSINDIPAALDDLSDRKYADGPNYTDFPYAVLDSEYNGTNCDRSVYTGRLLVDSPQQMPIILNKLRNIYKLGANNPSFHKRAAHIAYFDIDDDNYVGPDTEINTYMIGTSERIYDSVTNQGKNISRIYYKHRHAIPTFMRDIREGVKPLPDFLTYPQYAWDADSTDVIRAFNSGMHYIYTNAHGSISSWAEPGPNWDKPVFASRQMHFLNNADKLPYVFSISCHTGNFNAKNGMAKTLLNSKNGACGVIASTSYMWCNETPYFAMGIFNTIWPDKRDDNTNPNTTINLDPIRFAFDNRYKEYVDEEWYTMGNIMDLGMRYQYLTASKNPTNYIPKSLKETTHIYGDPGIFFNTDTPTDIENVHFRFKNEFKHVLGNQTEIVPTISISIDSHAIIGIYNETTNEVARYYNSWVIHPVSPTDKFHVVITQHNKLPLEFHVENGIISASGPYVGDANKIPELRLKSVRQTSANTIEATYDFDEYNSAEYSGTIMVKDMNNNILAQQGVSEQNGTVTLSSSQITNGIYVVGIQSPTHAASYQKILIK